MTDALKTIKDKARAVANQHGDMMDAFTNERKAEGQVLEAVIALIDDAVPALSERILLRRGDNDEHSSDQAVRLAGSVEGLSILYLKPTSRLVHFVYKRPVFDEDDYLEGCGSPISAEAAARLFDVEHIVANLSKRLDQQLGGNMIKRTKESVARAELLRSIVRLLGAK
jgi:hypothetical protein